MSELLTNVARHANATRLNVIVLASETTFQVTVVDDGIGGVTIRPGGGLDGIRRRLAAFEGTLEVDSPEDGPTRMTVTVQCE